MVYLIAEIKFSRLFTVPQKSCTNKDAKSTAFCFGSAKDCHVLLFERVVLTLIGECI